MSGEGTGAARPYVLLSCAVSVDGYLDDTSGTRLLLSGDEDFDRVDEERSGCDAILVGAETVRRDDPRLLIRSAERRARRRARGLPEHPLRVTLTASGDLDPAARLFAAPRSVPGDKASETSSPDTLARRGEDHDPETLGGRTLVYATGAAAETTRARLAGAAPTTEVVELGDIDLGLADVNRRDVRNIARAVDTAELRAVLADLAARGIRRLMVEGGARVLSRLLAEGLADELHLIIAPLVVGVSPDREQRTAPRLAVVGGLRAGATRLRLAETRAVGDCVLLRYLLPATS